MQRVCMVLVLALVGCGNRAPSCKDAVEKAATTIGEGTPALFAEMTAVCERSGWTDEQRTCLANARDKTSAATCLAGAVISTATKAKEDEAAVKAAVQQAMQQAQEAQDQLQQVAKDQGDLDDRLTKAVDQLANAQNDAARAAAKAKLAALQHQKTEIEARITAAKAAAERAERAKGVRLSKECLDNPLAKGCQ